MDTRADLDTLDHVQAFYFASRGRVNGALFLDATAGTAHLDLDKNDDDLAFTYSCEALQQVSQVAPLRTLSWIELYR